MERISRCSRFAPWSGCQVPRDARRSAFDRFAEASAQFVSHGLFFTVCLVVVIVWMPAIAVFDSVDTWQLVINTLTSVLAFLLIALLQNSERRYDEALHHKIDALAAGLADLMEDRGGKPDPELLQRRIDELRASVGSSGSYRGALSISHNRLTEARRRGG